MSNIKNERPAPSQNEQPSGGVIPEYMPVGLNTIQSNGKTLISCNEDIDTWRSVANGYKSLLRAAFPRIAEMGMDSDDAQDATILYYFMENLEEEISHFKSN
jgi:hypothetical protein